MIPAGDLADALAERGYRLLSGVPCSHLAGLIEAADRDPRFRYVPAANEGAALAVAAGAWLAGSRSAVLLQNSGLGNLVNPLSSLSLVYGAPVLLLVSMRAYPEPDQDEPQHRLMGVGTVPILESLGVPHAALPADGGRLDPALAAADAALDARRCFALLVTPGTVGGGPSPPARTKPPAGRLGTRAEAIRLLTDRLSGKEAVIATTGMASRELAGLRDRSLDFTMAGSMGHAMAIGLGVALVRPERRVVVLDGDGAVLMHMGTLSTIGHAAPPNLVHVVVDNGVYGSTGDQPTTSSSTDLAGVARACGYRCTWRCRDRGELVAALDQALAGSGPSLLVAEVGSAVPGPAPRVTARLVLPDIAARFQAALAEAGTRPGSRLEPASRP